MHDAFVVHADHDGRDLQQRVALAIEAAGFDVDDDRQETRKPLGVSDGSCGHVCRIRNGRHDNNAVSPNWSAAGSKVKSKRAFNAD